MGYGWVWGTGMATDAVKFGGSLVQAERLTLGVLLFGVAALALSDFVSPAYWLVTAIACVLRLAIGPRFALGEMQASLLGWAGFFWVIAELVMGRSWIVALTDFLLILSLAVSIEAATPRNHLHRLITGTFLILAASVLTDSVLYALPLAGFLLLLWRACRRLYGVGGDAGELPLGDWRADWGALLVMLLVSAMLFVLAPRFDTHSRLQNIQPRLQMSGFSDAVYLGDFARLLDPTVVMRVEVPDTTPAKAKALLQNRYWRGVALSSFLKGKWSQSGDIISRRAAPHSSLDLGGGTTGRRIVLYREAVMHPYLMLPDGATRLPDLPEAAGLTVNGSVKFISPPSSRLRMEILLSAAGSLPVMRPPVSAEGRAPASEAIAAWARRVTAGAENDEQRLSRISGLLRSWDYSLKTRVDEQQPIEHFLLQTHSGHCEMFATSMALAARSLGMSARVVNGYYGGDWNDAGGFLMLRQQHAHAWVEVWLHDSWQRYDPTPASRWDLSGVRFATLEHAWDAVRLSWYRYVLEFGDQDRAGLLTLLRQWVKTYATWLLLLPVFFLVALLLRFAVARKWSGQRGHCRDVLDRWLARQGIERRRWQTLETLPRPKGVDDGRWADFVLAWELQAYGKGAAWTPASLRRHLRALTRMS